MKNKKQLVYRNISCDSEQEVFILMWLCELQDEGYIKHIERADTFELSEPVKFEYKQFKQLKTKTKIINKEATILHGHKYTPEFLVILDETKIAYKALSFPTGPLLVNTNHLIYIEAKNDGMDFHNMTRLNQLNRKWLFKDRGILVTLLKPKELFEKTFTPKEYLKTATGKERKINFKVKTFEQWITTIK